MRGGQFKAYFKPILSQFLPSFPLLVPISCPSMSREDCRSHADYLVACCANVDRNPALKRDAIACCQCIAQLFKTQFETLTRAKKLLGAPSDSHAAASVAFGHFMVTNFDEVAPADTIGVLRPQPGFVDILE